MSESIEQINAYLDYLFAYGSVWVYLVIFAACFIENLFPPFPGDSFIVAAGALVAVARLHPLLAMATVMSGGLLSVMIVYAIGRRYGRDFFIRRNYRYFSAADIARVEGYFDRWGALILIFSRFVFGLRTVLSLVAGIGRYSAGRMFVYSALSYVLFAGLLMYLAHVLIENLDMIGQYYQTYSRIVWPVIVVLLAVYVWHRFRSSKGDKRV